VLPLELVLVDEALLVVEPPLVELLDVLELPLELLVPPLPPVLVGLLEPHAHTASIAPGTTIAANV
jgi:hypothetical protein